jgi:hypothetical protein
MNPERVALEQRIQDFRDRRDARDRHIVRTVRLERDGARRDYDLLVNPVRLPLLTWLRVCAAALYSFYWKRS